MNAFWGLLLTLLGGVGGILLKEGFQRRAWRKDQEHREVERILQQKREIENRYLLPFIDALTSLWCRLDNIRYGGGRKRMQSRSELYYFTSSLYVLATVFAQKRRLLLEGVYARLNDVWGTEAERLRDLLEDLEEEVGGDKTLPTRYFRYERLALAEAALIPVADSYELRGYLDFATRATSPGDPIHEAVKPARRFWEQVEDESIERLMEKVSEAAVPLERWTGFNAYFRGARCGDLGSSGGNREQ